MTDRATRPHHRMVREERTVEAMVHIHCRERHGTGGPLCQDCDALLSYARERLERCPFQEHKTTCARCPIHCYRADMRERVREAMRYAGPRMLLRHPILAVLHLLDRLRQPTSEGRSVRDSGAGESQTPL